MTKRAVRKPCPSCPWRVDQDASVIPGFDLDLAEGLAETCPQSNFGPSMGSPMFGCHQSRPSEEFVCAGWLAAVGSAHPGARLMVMRGEITKEALRPGEDWPELHDSYDEVIEKLRKTTVR